MTSSLGRADQGSCRDWPRGETEGGKRGFCTRGCVSFPQFSRPSRRCGDRRSLIFTCQPSHPRLCIYPAPAALAAPPTGSSAPAHPAPLGISCKSLAAGSCLRFPASFCLSLSLFLALFLSCYEETEEGLSFSHPLKCLRSEGLKFPSPSFEFW